MFVSYEDLKIKTISEQNNAGEFVFEPLPTGFGNTLGNSLRRVLYTALMGAAATQVKITGADHQFSTIPGIKQDVVEITLNLKKLRVKMHGQNPVVASINKKGTGPVTGADIEVSSEVEILNPELEIATITDKTATFKAEIIIEAGVGYSPMEERQSAKIGVIVLDAFYSPVTKVSYKVEPTRAGKTINLDRLTLNVETDGSITPKDAVMQSSDLLARFFDRLANWNEEKPIEEVVTSKAQNEEAAAPSSENISVEELPLPTRTINALKKQGISTLSQLANKSDEELADVKNLGEKSVVEIKKLLKKEGYRA